MLILISYFRFWLNPKSHYGSAHFKEYLRPFVIVLINTYLLMLSVSFLPTIQSPNNTDQMLELINAENPLAFVIIPLYEELVFRLPLKISKRNIAISASLFISSCMIALFSIVFDNHSSLLFFYLFSFIGMIPLFFVIKSLYSEKIQLFLIRNYNYLFYTSLILFSLLHFYSQDFSLFTLLCYLIYGYSLSFLRVSTNFASCVILHAIFIAPFVLRLF